jgi:response regulator NasT
LAVAQRRLILLVDDDPLLLDYIATVLQHAGYDTACMGLSPAGCAASKAA